MILKMQMRPHPLRADSWGLQAMWRTQAWRVNALPFLVLPWRLFFVTGPPGNLRPFKWVTERLVCNKITQRQSSTKTVLSKNQEERVGQHPLRHVSFRFIIRGKHSLFFLSTFATTRFHFPGLWAFSPDFVPDQALAEGPSITWGLTVNVSFTNYFSTSALSPGKRQMHLCEDAKTFREKPPQSLDHVSQQTVPKTVFTTWTLQRDSSPVDGNSLTRLRSLSCFEFHFRNLEVFQVVQKMTYNS